MPRQHATSRLERRPGVLRGTHEQLVDAAPVVAFRAAGRVDDSPLRLERDLLRLRDLLLRVPRRRPRPCSAQLDLAEFFTSINWRPDSRIRPQFGILALIAGTASVTLLAMVIAVPAGLAAAVFVSEFCGPRLRETLKIVIELLAAIPSVVWGFIGYMVLNPIIIETTGAPIGINILNGGIILALMSVPVIMSVGEDALKAVPDTYPRGGRGARRQPLADRLQGAVSGGEERAARRQPARRRTRGRRDDGGADGHRARHPDPGQPVGSRPDVDRDDRRRARRSRRRAACTIACCSSSAAC